MKVTLLKATMASMALGTVLLLPACRRKEDSSASPANRESPTSGMRLGTTIPNAPPPARIPPPPPAPESHPSGPSAP